MSINFNSTTPAIPAGNTPVVFQNDAAGNATAYVPTSAVEVYKSLNQSLTDNFEGGAEESIWLPDYQESVIRVSWSQALIVPDGVSSTFPSLTLSWVDPGGISRTKLLVASNTSNTTDLENDGVAVIFVNGTNPVTVTSAGYASMTPNTMEYSLVLIAELM